MAASQPLDYRKTIPHPVADLTRRYSQSAAIAGRPAQQHAFELE
jgi:hypothetical protein